MIETIIENWKALGGTAIVTSTLTLIIKYISSPKTKKSTEKSAEEEADSKGLQNLDKVLEINAREINRIEKRFKDQLEPLHQIIATQKGIIETQKKYIQKLEKQLSKCNSEFCKHKV